jgi:hypothetical protein
VRVRKVRLREEVMLGRNSDCYRKVRPREESQKEESQTDEESQSAGKSDLGRKIRLGGNFD